MSSTSILPIIQVGITRYGLSIMLILGNIGNIFIIILFYRRRQNACSLYLLCASIMNSVALTFSGISIVYSLDYGDVANRSLFFCKFRFYFAHIVTQIGRYLSIIACIDRYLWTKNYLHARFMNQPGFPRYTIGSVILFWLIISIHILILATINNGSCGVFDVYYIFYQVYAAISSSLIPSILLSLFGYLAYHNMKNLHARIRPLDHSNNNLVQRRDRDLLIMVLVEAAIYAITTIPYPFIILEIAVTNYIGVNKNIEYRQIENFLSSIGLILAFFNYSCRFYIYFSISKAFRKDFKKLLSEANVLPLNN